MRGLIALAMLLSLGCRTDDDAPAAPEPLPTLLVHVDGATHSDHRDRLAEEVWSLITSVAVHDPNERSRVRRFGRVRVHAITGSGAPDAMLFSSEGITFNTRVIEERFAEEREAFVRQFLAAAWVDRPWTNHHVLATVDDLHGLTPGTHLVYLSDMLEMSRDYHFLNDNPAAPRRARSLSEATASVEEIASARGADLSGAEVHVIWFEDPDLELDQANQTQRRRFWAEFFKNLGAQYSAHRSLDHYLEAAFGTTRAVAHDGPPSAG